MKFGYRRVFALLTALLLALQLFTGCIRIDKPQPDDIVVLFTANINGDPNAGLGYAGFASYVRYMESETPYVTLVDCGNAFTAEPEAAFQPRGSVELMNAIGYDFALPGEREFALGAESLASELIESDARYLACNLEFTGKDGTWLSAIKSYAIVDYYNDISVAFVGVSSPYSIDGENEGLSENGELVYNLWGGKDADAFYQTVQKNVNACRNAGADYVVLLSNLGEDNTEAPYRALDLIRATTGIDAVLDGGYERTLSTYVELNYAGERVLMASVGADFCGFGKLLITENGHVDVSVITDYKHRDSEIALKTREMLDKYGEP